MLPSVTLSPIPVLVSGLFLPLIPIDKVARLPVRTRLDVRSLTDILLLRSRERFLLRFLPLRLRFAFELLVPVLLIRMEITGTARRSSVAIRDRIQQRFLLVNTRLVAHPFLELRPVLVTLLPLPRFLRYTLNPILLVLAMVLLFRSIAMVRAVLLLGPTALGIRTMVLTTRGILLPPVGPLLLDRSYLLRISKSVTTSNNTPPNPALSLPLTPLPDTTNTKVNRDKITKPP